MKKIPLLLSLPILLVLAACSSNAKDSIVIQGSDTEVQLVSALVEAFARENPGANISVAGGGSAVGIAALINGETDIANSSRKMKPEEMEKAVKNGRNPQEFVLARDGLSIVVHTGNPVTQLSMDRLGKIFRGEVTNWKEVGGPDAAIILYGRQSTSGTFGFFRDTVVKGDYGLSMRQMEGNEAIVNAVQADTNALGYVGVGYVKDASGQPKTGIKVVPVSQEEDGPAFSPLDRSAVESKDYPIARQIFQYLPVLPEQGSLLEKFLLFEASEEGRKIVEQSGFYSLIGEDRAQNDAFFGKIQ